MPYGMRMDSRTRPLPCTTRYVTNANMKPSTSSTATVTTVMTKVVTKCSPGRAYQLRLGGAMSATRT